MGFEHRLLLFTPLECSDPATILNEDRLPDPHSQCPVIREPQQRGIIFIPADDFSVVVENDENLLAYVVTKVKGELLEVRYKNGGYKNEHSKVFISAPYLNEITSSGAGNIYIRDVLKSKNEIHFRSTGSGDISGEVVHLL